MSSKWAVNGRGRGRGQSTTVGSPWSQKKAPQKNEHEVMREKMVALAAKVLPDELYTSSEEELDDEQIMTKTLKQYEDILQGDEELGTVNHHHLLDVLQSGASTCLVCIDTVKRLDAVWSCVNCSCIFHLQCIQKWAREGVGRQTLQAEGDIKNLDLSWHCPKCRQDYKQHECPTKYYCFCRKVEEPEFDPWSVPHSCGQQCEKSLRPDCGHHCTLLCHPGPCPPCPQTVRQRCYCGKAGPSLKRCGKKFWSCNQTCGKLLFCGKHPCQSFCHQGECPPCPFKSEQFCLCGKVKEKRDCADPTWSCDKICGLQLPCGFHKCEKSCHEGDCGECPRAGSRTCPCGKTSFLLPCVDDIPPCEDTCMKNMSCGKHNCAKRCHYGPCDTCLQVIRKICRCGKQKKEVPCKQEFLCDIRCNKTRSCGRHQCKRKCCEGSCPPCEQTCNRTLNCRNHKCPSPCHTGLCYPCSAVKNVTCACGTTKITVPCGKEKTTKPPRCKKLCMKPSLCHHESPKAHKCHFGRCPPCKFKCEKEYANCKHICQQKCHDQIFDGESFETSKMKSSGKVSADAFYVSVDCPPCGWPVEIYCMGKHQNEAFPCSKVKPYSCKQQCGRLLACENHVCTRECHIIKGNPDEGKAGRNCYACEELCMKERPEGCIHDCKQPCHPGLCQPCEIHLKLECHCGTLKKYIRCSEWTSANEAKRDELLYCGSRCTKHLSCGHLCPLNCHRGSCAPENQCVETSKVKCPCGRRKKDVACVEIKNGSVSIECTERCLEIKKKKNEEKMVKEEADKAAELKKQQADLEWYERKKHGGRRRKQKENANENDVQISYNRYMYIIGIVTCAVAAVLFMLYLNVELL